MKYIVFRARDSNNNLIADIKLNIDYMQEKDIKALKTNNVKYLMDTYNEDLRTIEIEFGFWN